MANADRNVPYVEITAENDLLELHRDLDQDPDVREKLFGFPLHTVVIDTIDEVQQILKRARLKSQKRDAMQMQDWGWLGDHFERIVTSYRDLDMHVIFTVHTKEVSDGETGKIWFNPDLQGAAGHDIAEKVDLALLLRNTIKTVVDPKSNSTSTEQVRYFQTFPDNQHNWVKDRSPAALFHVCCG